MELFKLFGRIMVENGDANRALSETDKLAVGATNGLGGYLEKLKGWAVAAGAAFTASAVGKGLKEVWDMSSQVSDIGDNVDKASQKFQLSREAYQEWAYVAERSGFSMEALGNSVVDLSKKVGSGSEDVMAALEEIGISAADAMTATPEELFDKVIAGLQAMDESTRRTFLADSLLGEGGKQLAPLLNMTAEETQELRDRIYDLNGVMSQGLVSSSAAYKDALTDLQEAMQGVKNELAENTLPAMEQTVNGLTLMLTGDFVTGLKMAADGVKDYLGGIADWLDEWKERVRASILDAVDVDIDRILYGYGPLVSPLSGTQAGLEWQRDQLDTDMAFDNAMSYAKYGQEMTASGFFDDLWDGIKATLQGESRVPSQDEIMRAFNYFSAQGGTQEDFLAEIRERYGKEAYETVSGYIEAVNNAKQAWVDGAEQFEGANRKITGAMEEKTGEFGYNLLPSFLQIEAASQNMTDAMNVAADNLYKGGKSVYGNAANDLYGGFSHALGIPFVPRDEYPAQLHYGERVLTRQENREYDSGSGAGGQNITIQIQSVAQSPAQEAAAITAALQRARWAT